MNQSGANGLKGENEDEGKEGKEEIVDRGEVCGECAGAWSDTNPGLIKSGGVIAATGVAEIELLGNVEKVGEAEKIDGGGKIALLVGGSHCLGRCLGSEGRERGEMAAMN